MFSIYLTQFKLSKHQVLICANFDFVIFVPFLPGVTPSKRRAIYFSTAKTLATIHKVDVDAIGLQKYGRRDNYCKRQVGSNYSYFMHVDSLF